MGKIVVTKIGTYTIVNGIEGMFYIYIYLWRNFYFFVTSFGQYQSTENVIVLKDDLFCFLELDLFYDGDNSVYVHAPETVMGQIMGLCGNYNGNFTDDYFMVTGLQATNSAEFGNSWAVRGLDDTEIPMVDTQLRHPCSSRSTVSFSDFIQVNFFYGMNFSLILNP